MLKNCFLLFLFLLMMTQSPGQDQNFLGKDFRKMKVYNRGTCKSTLEDGYWKWDTIKCIYEDLVVHNRLMQTCDSRGRTTMILYEKRLVTSPWGNDKRESYYYNRQGLDSLFWLETWNGQAWENGQRVTMQYDESGNLLQELAETWLSSGLMSRYRYVYEYYFDSIVYTGQKLQGNNWLDDERTTLTYNEAGYLAQVVIKTKPAGGNLNYFLRYTYSYDDNNNWTEIMIDMWQNEVWQQIAKLVYIFDLTGNLLEEKQMNGAGSYWRNSYRSTYLYDSYGNVINGKNEVWGGSVWSKDVQDGYMYRNKQMIYHIDRGLYYYRTNYRYVAEVPEIQEQIKNLVYPDPASDRLTLNPALLLNDHPLVEVFDLAGKKMLSERIISDKRILDIRSLPEGVYVVKIGVYSQKLVIKR